MSLFLRLKCCSPCLSHRYYLVITWEAEDLLSHCLQDLGWFSLHQLNQQQVKLREMGENQSASRMYIGLPFQDFRQYVFKLQTKDTTKLKQNKFGLLFVCSTCKRNILPS